MAAPCFESQTKEKLKLPKEVTAAFADQMLQHFESGMNYPDTLKAMSESSGLNPDTINHIFKRDPKQFSITKQAVAQAGKVRMLRDAADAYADQLKHNTAVSEPGRIAKAWDLQRRIALTGHSPVFPWTHMRNWAVQIPTQAGIDRMKVFWQSARDVWKYGGEKGKANYEMDMALMKQGDYYDFFKSQGADINPDKLNLGDILLKGRETSGQARRFNSLKSARYAALVNTWERLDPALREGDTGKAMAASIARDMNYATGSIMPPVGEAANPLAKSSAELSNLAGRYNLLLSSKLFFAKHMDAWLSPLRYLAKGGKMTAQERAAANIAMGRWANTVAAHVGILGVNYAFNKVMGYKTPNLTDPTKADFLRLRVGDKVVVPFSPMLEALRLPVVFSATALTKGSDEAGSRLWRAVWNAAHPAFHTAYEQISGKNYKGQPVPSLRNLISPVKPSPSKPPEKLPEYISTRATPIAISGGLHEYYQALRDQGMDPSQASAIIKGLASPAALKALASAASSGLLGTHVYEEEEKTKPAHLPKVPQ